MKPLLIGQAPGPNTDPERPLPPECGSAKNLMKLAGIDAAAYEALFHRTNLLHDFPGFEKARDRFPMKSARIAARAMQPLLAGRHVVFIGRRAADAFWAEVPFHQWEYNARWDYTVACVPHTSGQNRWYNDEANQQVARTFWEGFVTNLTEGRGKVLPFVARTGIDQTRTEKATSGC